MPGQNNEFVVVDLQSISKGVATLANVQLVVSGMHNNSIARGRPSKEQVITYCSALAAEAFELADALHWKPWKPAPPIDVERVLDEYADILAFVGLLATYVMEATGANEADIAKAYQHKAQVNVRRALGYMEGYGIEQDTE